MTEYSEASWKIASLYSGALASETRDLAAHIDGALEAERQRCYDIAMAIDSGRGNEKLIAAAITARPMAPLGDSKRPTTQPS